MGNRDRKEQVLQAMDSLVGVEYIKDDVNVMIDDAYNLLEEAVELLTIILDEEEDY